MQSCILGLSAVFADGRARTFWGTLGYCFPTDDAHAAASNPFGGGGGLTFEGQPDEALAQIGGGTPCVGPFYQYFVCMVWVLECDFAIPTFYSLSGPGTPLFLNGDNALFRPHEYVFFVLNALVGALNGIYLQVRATLLAP